MNHSSSSSSKRRVLLIGWEGGDWQLIEPLIDAGEMPHLSEMTERGVMGNLSTSLPMVCPTLWSSIATGVFGNHHGILTPIEPDGRGDVRPVQSTSRRRKAIWNILSQNGLRIAVVGWPATHPVEPIDGIIVSDRYSHTTGPAADLWPADNHTIHPRELHDNLMALRVRPEHLTGVQLASFVPLLEKIDIEKDHRVAAIAAALAQAASIQQAATWIAQNSEWDLLAVHFGMIGALCHGFLKYQSPCAEGVEDGDAERYGQVVSTAYKLQDMMLGRLLALAGPDTLVMVVSDHGFNQNPSSVEQKTDADPSREVSSRRPTGYHQHYRREAVICAAGPGVKADELVLGARLTNIAPTILAYLGLAVPRDMEGRVLNNMFDQPLDVKSIESYEPSHDRDGVHPRGLYEDPWAAQEILDHFVSLRLLSLDPSAAPALETCVKQRDLNLAEILTHRGQSEEALTMYRKAFKRDDSFPSRVPIIQCLIDLQRFEEAQTELETVTTLLPYSANVDRLWAMFYAARGDIESAVTYLDRAAKYGADNTAALGPHAAEQFGWIALRLGQWERAKNFFESALERDSQSAISHDGIGIALLRLGNIEASVAHHMQSVHLLYYRSQGHVHLGEALMAAGQLDRAIRAFEAADMLDPTNVQAKRWLTRARKKRQQNWQNQIDAAADDTAGDAT